jgi:hypothetical protein
MAAATGAPVLRRRMPPAASAVPWGAARLLRVELRRNAMPWILPLIAVLFWFDSYRPSTATEPLYAVRTFWNLGQGHTIIDFGPFVAGVAAWMGSRDGRRHLADLVIATARPRWAAQLATWGATAIWAVAAYLVFVVVLFAAYASQGVTGSPPWWWVAVGATAVLAFSAAGFAIGACWPSRFAAPVAAFGGFLAMSTSSQSGFTATSGWALILPTNSNNNFTQADAGILYPWLPDLPIARLMFLGGIAVVALGLTGLPARAGGRLLRRTAAIIAVAGVALAGTGIGLATTARLTAYGTAIPALHDAANDAQLAYTPQCRSAAGIPVCLNPAYRRWLPAVASGLAPVLTEVAGLPGAPVRVSQVAETFLGGANGSQATVLTGQPPVLRLSLGALNLPGPCGLCDGPMGGRPFADELRLLLARAFVGVDDDHGSPAQQAVQAALLRSIGMSFGTQTRVMSIAANYLGPKLGAVTGPVAAAAKRFAALPAGARTTWLTTHLAALRAGRLPLADLP